MSHTASRQQAASSITPLWAVLSFTFLNSLGGGVVTTGFSFLAKSAYGFTPAQNYLLGLSQGVLYIIAALTVGPALARAARTTKWISTRRALAALMVVLAAFSALPWLGPRVGAPGPWALWLLIGGYSALTGVLWPIVESYMSGGRSEVRLRSGIGVFNVVWSGALVASYWIMGPLQEFHSLELLLGVAAVHLACLALLPAFARNPASHADHHGAAVPEAYPRLLGVFRMQLVTSYMVFSALTPFLPEACVSLGLVKHWHTPIAGTWLAARVLTFAVMQRWHGWHGRWTTAGFGAAALLVGFGITVLSTRLGVWALLTGLALFGVGMGVIYCAALYYAMAVGNSQVDAGGKHEALIGAGYGGGPIFGLIAIAATGGFGASSTSGNRGGAGGEYELLMLALVAAAGCSIVGLSLWRARSHASRNVVPSPQPPATAGKEGG